MFFFIVYGSSEKMFRTTSIALPIFISCFILSRYVWSLVWYDSPGYKECIYFVK